MPLLTDSLNPGNVYFKDRTFTPEIIRKCIDETAACLDRNYTSNSPFVYLFAPNHIKTVFALFGIIKSGRICVLVDPAVGRIEFAEMTADAEPGAIIRIDKTTDAFNFEKEVEFRETKIDGNKLKGLDDVCLMLYTNAWDGWAKGAMLTNESLLADAMAGIQCNSPYHDTVSCALLPLSHLLALQTGVIMPMIANGNVLIEDIASFSALKRVGESLERYKVRYLYSVPVIYHFLRKLPRIEKIVSEITHMTSGGCAMPEKLFFDYKNKFGKEIQQGYGLTEASPVCTWHWPGDKIRMGSVGRAFPCCVLKILDAFEQELPAGQLGEICVNGKNVFKGYYNNECATQAVLRNGLLHTGDFGRMDEDGYVHLENPRPYMINVSGNKVYRAELERLIRKNRNVVNLKIGCEQDELVCTRVLVKMELQTKGPDAEKRVRNWCKENITPYKVPLEIRFY
jgi:long-chain acyl-CoA synthetase